MIIMNKQKLKDIKKGFRFRVWILKLFTPKYNLFTIKVLNFFLKLITPVFYKVRGLKREVHIIKRLDDTKLKVYIYKPKVINDNTSAILWFYSGGFLLGSPQAEKTFINLFGKKANKIVILPSYAKSYKKHYPHALNDGNLTLKYIFEVLKLSNVSIGGASAGGNLATALAIYNNDNLKYQIRQVINIYPMLDYNENKNLDAYVWSSKQNRYAWEMYLKTSNKDTLNAYQSPALIKNFTNLPPFLSYIGSMDLFYEETINFYQKLSQNNIRNDYLILDGLVHGFDYINKRHKLTKKAHQFLIDKLI